MLAAMPSFSATGSPHRLLRRSEGEKGLDVRGRQKQARRDSLQGANSCQAFFALPNDNSSSVERDDTNPGWAKSGRTKRSLGPAHETEGSRHKKGAVTSRLSRVVLFWLDSRGES